MALNRDQLKEIVIDYLETSGFDFDIMPDHKKYDQNADGTVKLDANNQPKIIKNYGVPAMEIIIESLVDGVIDHVLSAGTLDDLSDVEITDLEINDIIKWNGSKWINTSATGGGGVGVTDHGSLTGLSDDDHGAVYPGLAQIESITGYWTYDNRLRSNSKILFNTGITELHGDSGTNPNLQIADTDGGSAIGIVRYSNDTSGPKVVLAKSRSSSVRGTDRVEDGDTLGEFVFAGDDGSNIQAIGAKIYSRIDGTPANDKLPSELILQTATSAGTLTDAIYINSEQDVGINVDPSDRFHVHESTSGDVFIKVTNSNTGTTSNDGSFFGIENDGTHDDLLIVNKEYNADVILRANDGGVIRFQPKPNSVASNTDRALIDTNGLFVQNGGLRVSSGSTTTNPGDGNLYVEGTTTIGTIANLSNGTSVLVEDSGLVKYRTVSESILSITDFSEAVDDRVSNLLVDSSTIEFTYNDAANSISADVVTSAVDHGQLAGLGDDDHTHYFLADGTRNLTGDLNITGSVQQINSSASLQIFGGTTNTDGSHILLFGRDQAVNPGEMNLVYGGTTGVGELYIQRRNSTNTETVATFSTTGNLTLAGRLNIQDIPAGSSDLVLTHFGGAVQVRTIDSRVWGSSSLVEGSLSSGYVPVANGTHSLTDSIIQADASNVTVGGNLDVTGSIGEVDNTSAITIFGGTSNTTGPSIELYARDHASLAGNAYYRYGGYDSTGTLYFQHRTSSAFTNVLALGSSKNATFYGNIFLGTNSISNNGTGGLTFATGGSATLTGALAVTGTFSTDGNATLGNASSDAHTVNGTLTIAPGTQAYEFCNRGDRLYAQGQSSGVNASFEVFTKDGDGSDSTFFTLWGKGTPASTTNAEIVRMVANSNGSNITSFDIYSESAGTGSDRPIRIYAGSPNVGQLTIATNGNVGVGLESPQSNLHIHEASSSDSLIQFTNSDTGNSASSDGGTIGLSYNATTTRHDIKITNNEYGGQVLLDCYGLVVDTGATSGATALRVYTGSDDRFEVSDDGAFVQNGGLRISSGNTITDPGDGNLYVEGNTTVVGSLSVDSISVQGSAQISFDDSLSITGTLSTTLGITAGQTITVGTSLYNNGSYYLRDYGDTSWVKMLYNDSGDNTIINAKGSSDRISFYLGESSTGVWIDSTGLVVNAGKLDVNTTSEFSGNISIFGNNLSYNGTGGLTFDASNNASIAGNLSVTDNACPLFLENTNNTTSVAITVKYHNRTSADDDKFYDSYRFNNSSGSETEVARIGAQLTDNTAGTEDADILFSVSNNGTLYDSIRITSDGSSRSFIQSVTGDLTLVSTTNTVNVWDDLDVAGTVEARHFQADYYIKSLTADWTLDLSNSIVAGNYSMFRFSANASTYTVTITNPTAGRWYFFSNTSGTTNSITLDFGDFTYTLPDQGNYFGLIAWYDGTQWNRTGDAY